MGHLHEDRLRRAAAARADFLGRGARDVAGVRDLVAASWRRSASAGVDAETYRIAYYEDVDLDSRLARCARPVIDRLAAEMYDVPVAIALCDARARIVHRRDCSTVVGRPLDRVDFNAGFSFAEGGVGTNGIGTVLETGASVTVVGAEHFTEALVAFACTGAPIVDPATGRTDGVLDVSSLAEDWTPLMHALVRRAASDIAHNLLLDRNRATQALFESFVRADSRPRQAVIAVGNALLVNRRAQQLFSPGEQFAIHQHALFLMARRGRIAESLALDGGRQVRLRATRVVVGDQVAGIVLLLDDETQRASSSERSTNVLSRAPTDQARPGDVRGTSPTWVAACEVVTEALRRGDPLLILGESGSGRAQVGAVLFRELYPTGRVESVEVTASMSAGSLATVRDVVRGGGPALVVLRGLDRIGADDVAALSEALKQLSSRPAGPLAVPPSTAVATVDEAKLGSSLPFEGLLDVFGQSVTLPPLRYRAEDLPYLVEGILAELAPTRRVRLHPEASRVVARFGWPGNITQLREALRHALRRRPVGEVQPDDLPAWCRIVGSRTLTTLERAERDAIVAVLRECGGNRKQASGRLGMSRSSLYRKLDVYRIGDDV